MMTCSIFKQPIIKLLSFCALPLLLCPLLEYLALARYGCFGFLWLKSLMLMALIPALIIMPTTPLFLISRRFRPIAGRLLIAAVIFTLALIAGMQLANAVRMSAFKQLALRSKPLVKAIQDYTTRHGEPPAKLSALVPDYFSQVPDTGIGVYPKYEYYSGDEARRCCGNPWELIVFAPTGPMSFDDFIYLPLQNYSGSAHGESYDKVLDWAYVSE